MRRQDYIISGILHVTLLAVIVIASSVSGSANQFNPDEVAIVSVFDEIPTGMGQQPAEPVVEEPPETKLPDLPDDYFQEDVVEEEPVQLASIETPAEIAIKEIKKPKDRKPKPKTEKPKEKRPTTTKVGDGEVTTSIGAGEGAGGLGAGDFPYDIVRATQRIERNWDNPVLSQKNLSCVIYFQIDRQGQIKGVAVEESSGNDMYDTYARDAVERTKELPPLPLSYAYEVLGFHLEFEYTP
ncbi:MAG: TonB family protein [candidate division Zixibacteria bacterium]|nr:TonB family protein [candidate division Zixibacteria bacterium]